MARRRLRRVFANCSIWYKEYYSQQRIKVATKWAICLTWNTDRKPGNEAPVKACLIKGTLVRAKENMTRWLDDYVVAASIHYMYGNFLFHGAMSNYISNNFAEPIVVWRDKTMMKGGHWMNKQTYGSAKWDITHLVWRQCIALYNIPTIVLVASFTTNQIHNLSDDLKLPTGHELLYDATVKWTVWKCTEHLPR